MVLSGKITELVEEYEGQFEQDPTRVQFKYATGVEEIIVYNDICTFIEEQEENEDGTWMWKQILDHQKQKSQHQVKNLGSEHGNLSVKYGGRTHSYL